MTTVIRKYIYIYIYILYFGIYQNNEAASSEENFRISFRWFMLPGHFKTYSYSDSTSPDLQYGVIIINHIEQHSRRRCYKEQS